MFLSSNFWLFVVGQKLYFKSIDMPSTKTPLVPFPVLTGCELVLCFPSKSSSKYLPEIRKYFVKIQNPRKNPAAAREIIFTEGSFFPLNLLSFVSWYRQRIKSSQVSDFLIVLLVILYSWCCCWWCLCWVVMVFVLMLMVMVFVLMVEFGVLALWWQRVWSVEPLWDLLISSTDGEPHINCPYLTTAIPPVTSAHLNAAQKVEVFAIGLF